MPNVNLLPPELRWSEEKLQKKLQKQKPSADIKYVSPQAKNSIVKQPSLSLWQRLFFQPPVVKTSRPISRPPLPEIRQIRVAVKPQPKAPFKKPVVVVRRSFWRRWFSFKPKMASTVKLPNLPPPATYKAVAKNSVPANITKPVIKPLNKPVVRPGFWQYFNRLNSEKLISTPTPKLGLTAGAEKIKAKTAPNDFFDWASFFPALVYLLIIIIVLSFYLILRTTDNYLLQRNNLLEQKISGLEKRVSGLEGVINNYDSAQQNFLDNISGQANRQSLVQLEVYQALRSGLLPGVKISEVKVSGNQIAVSGLATTAAVVKRQEMVWQKIDNLSGLIFTLNTPVTEQESFTANFVWQSSNLVP
ncbi:MAG: hypothetical protein WCW02_03665 [Candidatus Buchananbacteria bacterium]